MQSRRHGALWDLSLSNRAPSPPNWNKEHYKPVEFCQFLECQNHLYKRKDPLLKALWRRFWSDELMSCAAGTNGCLNSRRRVFPQGRKVSAEWSRCPGSIARRARDSVSPLRRSSAVWMLARIGRLSTGVGRRHPVTIRKASLLPESMRWLCTQRHPARAQCSAVEWTRATVSVRNVVAPEPHPELANRLTCAMRDINLFRRDSRCQQYVSDLFVVADFQLTFSFLVVEVEDCRHHLCSAEL